MTNRMQKVFILIAALLVLPITSVTAAQKGLTRVESEAVYRQNENYAIIIGVDQYDRLPHLNYAVSDAERLSKLFESQGYQVMLLSLIHI